MKMMRRRGNNSSERSRSGENGTSGKTSFGRRLGDQNEVNASNKRFGKIVLTILCLSILFSIVHTIIGEYLDVTGKRAKERERAEMLAKMPNVQKLLSDLDSRLPPEYRSGKALRTTNTKPPKPLGLLAQPIGAKNPIFNGAPLHGAMLIKKFLYTDYEFRAKRTEAKYSKMYVYEYPKADVSAATLKGGVNKADDRPLFVLHIGPGKTGSSKLQAELEQYDELLKEDNYYYIGIFPLPLLDDEKKGIFTTDKTLQMFRCFQDDRLFCEKNTIVQQFRNLLVYHQSLGHNIIYSFENWSALPTHELTEFKWAVLKEILSPFRVKVVVTYRRYHSWLPSLFNQYFKQTYVQIDTGMHGERWPDDGGLTIPHFADCFDENMNAVEPHLANYFHPRQDPMLAFEKWEEQFPGVSVLNLHDDGDLTKKFICQMLPGVVKACEVDKPPVERSETDLRLLQNPSIKLHYDMIATAAYARGWVDDGLTRTEVRDAIQCKWLEMELSDAKNLVCPSESQYDAIYAKSKEYEKLIVPEFSASPDAITSFDVEFSKNVQRNKYCSMDPNMVLGDERLNWHEFFQKLKPLEDGSGLPSDLVDCVEGGRRTNTIITRERLLKKGNSRLEHIASLQGENVSVHYDLQNGNFLWTKPKDTSKVKEEK